MDPYTATAPIPDIPSWYALWLRKAVKDTYNGLPGPWWCKVLLIVICLAIPGPQDEILLIAVTAIYRAYRARRRQT